MIPTTTNDDDPRPPTMAEIGRALSLSRQAVSRAAKEGMPVHSIEAAHAWRRQNLDPARRKRGAFDEELRMRAVVTRAEELGELAGEALARDSEAAFAALVQPLREALRAVPPAGRGRVKLCLAAMDRLVAPMMDQIRTCAAEDEAAGLVQPAAARMSDDDAELMGAWWYAVACGEPLPDLGDAAPAPET
jgi:hypothetical protein